MNASPLFALHFLRADGQSTTLAEYAGKVLLIVNVASKCGLTPQYDALQDLYATYRDRGLMVLGFPANDFLSQEPGSDAEIQQFCRVNYGVEFPVFAKIRVKGEAKHPLYAQLIAAKPEAQSGPGLITWVKRLLRPKSAGAGDISWNFEKFLVGRDGQVLARFAPDVKPKDARLVAAIESALA